MRSSLAFTATILQMPKSISRSTTEIARCKTQNHTQGVSQSKKEKEQEQLISLSLSLGIRCSLSGRTGAFVDLHIIQERSDLATATHAFVTSHLIITTHTHKGIVGPSRLPNFNAEKSHSTHPCPVQWNSHNSSSRKGRSAAQACQSHFATAFRMCSAAYEARDGPCSATFLEATLLFSYDQGRNILEICCD